MYREMHDHVLTEAAAALVAAALVAAALVAAALVSLE